MRDIAALAFSAASGARASVSCPLATDTIDQGHRSLYRLGTAITPIPESEPGVYNIVDNIYCD